MSMMHYEGRHERPISRALFLRRMMRHVSYSGVLVVFSLALGELGYTTIGHLSPIDAFLNTAMLLGGMGPIGPIEGTAFKLWASFFSLYSGLIFLLIAAILLAPVFHRVLHYFHWKAEGGRGGAG
jgi:hypothetical protein